MLLRSSSVLDVDALRAVNANRPMLAITSERNKRAREVRQTNSPIDPKRDTAPRYVAMAHSLDHGIVTVR